MKRLLSSILLVFLILGQFQIGNVYAQSLSDLEGEKSKQKQKLENVADVIDTTFEKLDSKTKNKDTKNKIAEKQQEAEQYLEEVQDKIQKENSTKDIQKLVSDATKTVVLKVVSGVTQEQDTQDALPEEIRRDNKKKKEALETIQDSLETNLGDYSIIIKTLYSKTKVEELFHKFDSDTRVETLYNITGINYFEVFISQGSIFRQEMMGNIEKGVLPETFLDIDIVLPEVFTVESVDTSGEDLNSTWGIEMYKGYKYLDASVKKIRVGVIDTGIDTTHPDLAGRVTSGYDFVNDDNDPSDDQGHGTHVAGTIGASLNGSGIIGVNPYVEFVPLKICNASGFCPSYAVVRALEYAKTHDVQVLNMSLGGRGTTVGNPICDGIQAVTEAGSIVVAASGNSNVETSTFVPGGCGASLTVAAIDSSLKRASFSNYGGKVDVAAPGVGVYSTYPVSKGSYKQLSGTSMATPHIVGLVSLMLTKDSSLTTAKVKQLFRENGLGVVSDAGKPIAQAVNVTKLMDALTQKEVEVVQEDVEKEEEQEEFSYEVQLQDDAELDETLSLQNTNQEIEINTTHEIIFPEYVSQGPYSVIINRDVVQINSEDISSSEEQTVDLDFTESSDLENIDSQEQNFESTVEKNWDIPEIGVTSSGVLELFPHFLQSKIEINSFEDSEFQEIVPEQETLYIPTLVKDSINLDLGGGNSQDIEINTSESIPFELGQEFPDIEKLPEKIYLGDLGEDVLDNQDSIIEEPQEMSIGEYTIEDTQDTEDVGIQNVYTCTIIDGQYCQYSFFMANTYIYAAAAPGLVSISANSSYVNISPISGKYGTTTIYVKYSDYTFHTINVEVKPKPKPIELSSTISVGEAVNLLVENGSYYSYSATNTSLLSATRYGIGSVQLYGNFVGTSDVYARDNSGNIKYIIHVTIVPKTIDTSFFAGNTLSVSYNRPDRFTYSSTNPSLVSLSANSSYLNINCISGGTITIYAKYNNVVQYVINLSITEPPIIQDVMYQGQTIQASLGYASLSYRIENLHTYLVSAYSSNNTVNITGYNIGFAKIKVFQNNVWAYSLNIEVKTKPAIIYTSCTLNLGGNCVFTLDTPERYSYPTTSSLVAAISYSTANKYFRIQANQYGTAKVYVKYGNDTLYVIDVIVSPEIYNCSVPVGINCFLPDIKVSNNGSGNSLSPGIVNISTGWNGTTIQGVKQGYTDIYIYESGVHIATIKATILPAPLPLILSQSSISLMEQETKTLNIVSGNGEYTIREYIEPGKERVETGVSNNGIIALSGKILEKNYDQGTLIIVTDKWGQEAQIQVIVRKSRVTLDTSSLVPLELGGETIIPIIEYNHSANLKLARVNRNVLLYKVYGPDGYMTGIRLYGNYSGTTIISVTDSFGAEYSFSASVKGESYDPDLDNDPDTPKTATFGSFFLMRNQEDSTLDNIVAFNITGKYSEVGIEFKNENGITTRQVLEKNTQGFYIVQPDLNICNSCHFSFQPYLIDEIGRVMHAYSKDVSLADTTVFRTIDVSDSGIGVASQSEEIYFQTENSIWKNLGYGVTDKVIGTILNLGALTTIDKGLIVPDTLPISSYMLSEFLHGSRKYIEFNTQNWVSQEVMKTSWYIERKDEALKKLNSVSDLSGTQYSNLESKYVNIPELNYAGYVIDNNSSRRTKDFGNSFGNINSYSSFYYTGTDTYLYLEIKDKYDFNLFDINGKFKDNTLNTWGAYYQDRGLGNVYDWKLYIYDKIN